MTTYAQQAQTVPIQVHQAEKRLVLAAPMPGLEPQDIAVIIRGDHVMIRGDAEYRGAGDGLYPDTLGSRHWGYPIGDAA